MVSVIFGKSGMGNGKIDKLVAHTLIKWSGSTNDNIGVDCKSFGVD